MTSESARDVLLAAMYGDGGHSDVVKLDALRKHPAELLALLAEPKVCPRCHGTTEHGPLYRGDICEPCHGTGSVAVDVLDLLVQAGTVEQVGWGARMKRYDDDDGTTGWFLDQTRTKLLAEYVPVFAAKDGTP